MNPSRAFGVCLLCVGVLAGGCVSDQAARADAVVNDVCRRADTLILKTQTQMATLRSEMAAIRIEAAKKEADLQQLRRQIEALQAERAKLHQIQVEQQAAMEEQRETLRAVRRERDELAEANRRSASTPAGVVTAASFSKGGIMAGPDGGKVEALEASIVALTTQIQHLRGQGEGIPPDSRAEDVFSIRVEHGDTLGELATRYGVSVADIQEANGLTGDLILAGQRLFIPRVSGLSP